MAVHDRGGKPAGPIDRTEHALADWELLTDAIVGTLARKHVIRVDEHRRAIESLAAEEYESLPYYGRWLAAVERLLVEKGILSRAEIDRAVAEVARER